MDQRILDFIKTQRVCVLAVERPDGSPHAATLHFAHAEEPLTFFFLTGRGSRKLESLSERTQARASIVIGADESSMKTLQLDGEVRLVETPEEKELFQTVYLGKFSEKSDKPIDPKMAAVIFVPKWWRYVDFKAPEGKLTLVSS